MKRTVIVLAVVALLGGACGETADEEPSEPAPTPEAPTTTAAPTTTTSAPITTTAAPTTTTTTAAPDTTSAAIVPSGDPDVDAVVVAFTVAFDSTSDYEAKAPYIDDPSGLEETVEEYLSTGETFGGVSVIVSDVAIDGDEASVSYDLLFNNNPTYPDLSGRAVLTAEGWKVPRAQFCSLMSSARVGCPRS